MNTNDTARAQGIERKRCLLLLAVLTFTNLNSAAFAADTSVDRLMQAADAALEAGKPGEALEFTQQAIKLQPHNESLYNELGLCYTQQKKLTDAAAAFDQALIRNPNFVPAIKNLGSVLYASGSYDRAIKMFERELSLSRSADPDTLLDLGDAYRDRAHSKSSTATRDNDLNQALAFYQKAIDVAPGMAAIYNHRGVYYFQQKQLDRAETDIKHAIELKKDYAAAYYNLALVENELKKPADAAEAFRAALQYETDVEYQKQIRQKLTAMEALSPAAQGPALEQAYACLSRHEWGRAVELLKSATRGDAARDPVAYNNLGYALSRQGLVKESIAAYLRALELEPNLAEAQFNLGQACRLSGDLSSAEENLRQALKTSGGMNAGAHNALGLVYKARNHLAEAVAEYKLAIMQSGDTLPVAHLNLAIAFEHADGHRSEALAHYEQYLRQAPHGANAGFARSRMRALKAG